MPPFLAQGPLKLRAQWDGSVQAMPDRVLVGTWLQTPSAESAPSEPDPLQRMATKLTLVRTALVAKGDHPRRGSAAHEVMARAASSKAKPPLPHCAPPPLPPMPPPSCAPPALPHAPAAVAVKKEMPEGIYTGQVSSASDALPEQAKEEQDEDDEQAKEEQDSDESAWGSEWKRTATEEGGAKEEAADSDESAWGSEWKPAAASGAQETPEDSPQEKERLHEEPAASSDETEAWDELLQCCERSCFGQAPRERGGKTGSFVTPCKKSQGLCSGESPQAVACSVSGESPQAVACSFLERLLPLRFGACDGFGASTCIGSCFGTCILTKQVWLQYSFSH